MNKIIQIKREYIFVVILVACFFAFENVKAETVGILVDKSIFTFAKDPGNSESIKINVQNTQNSTQRISIKVQDFVVGENNEIKQLTDNNEQFGMRSWIKVDEEELFLQPLQKKEISVEVSVPLDASIGAHYTMVNIGAFPMVDGSNFQQAIVGGQVGVYVLMNVNGQVQGSGKLSEFKAPILAQENSQMRVDYENTGNILYMPLGQIQIRNMITGKSKIIKTEKHFVFPNKKFSFDAQWSPESSWGAYKAEAVFADGNGNVSSARRFVFGKMFFPMFLSALVIFFVFVRMLLLTLSKRKRS